MAMSEYHNPVLLKESVDALVSSTDGVYADATFGGGGHSREILSRLSLKGKLIAFDKDEDAAANAPDDSRFTLIHNDFRFIHNYALLFEHEKLRQGDEAALTENEKLRQGDEAALTENEELRQGDEAALTENEKLWQGDEAALTENEELWQGDEAALTEHEELRQGDEAALTEHNGIGAEGKMNKRKGGAVADKSGTLVALAGNSGAIFDGILADLGVSSHQFDTAGRGFSFRYDAPLDMRMNSLTDLTAAEIVNSYSAEDIESILRTYGEIGNARKAAELITSYRKNKAIATTGDLDEALKGVLPPYAAHKYLAKVYQAFRIEVNHEMRSLEKFLEGALLSLKDGGRLAIITYHSLEDRMVKNFMRSGNIRGEVTKDLYGNVYSPLQMIWRKPLNPNEEEIHSNTRARSAKLRVALKLPAETVNDKGVLKLSKRQVWNSKFQKLPQKAGSDIASLVCATKQNRGFQNLPPEATEKQASMRLSSGQIGKSNAQKVKGVKEDLR